MATGKNNQLAKQIGESIVVAELGRRECIATAFSGNVPDFDILAVNPSGRQLQIQVKAIRGVSWQFDIRQFLDVRIIGNGQVVTGAVSRSRKNLICVFVNIRQSGTDEFFIFPWRVLHKFFLKNYKARTKPKNIKSFHCAIWPKHLRQYKDNWKILLK
jgi:hypothetical protein